MLFLMMIFSRQLKYCHVDPHSHININVLFRNRCRNNFQKAGHWFLLLCYSKTLKLGSCVISSLSCVLPTQTDSIEMCSVAFHRESLSCQLRVVSFNFSFFVIFTYHFACTSFHTSEAESKNCDQYNL